MAVGETFPAGRANSRPLFLRREPCPHPARSRALVDRAFVQPARARLPELDRFGHRAESTLLCGDRVARELIACRGSGRLRQGRERG